MGITWIAGGSINETAKNDITTYTGGNSNSYGQQVTHDAPEINYGDDPDDPPDIKRAEPITPCVCNDWEKVDTIIPVKNFVGWNYAYPGDPSKCYKLCVLQLKMFNYSPTGKQYQIAIEKNKQIVFNKQNFNDGVDYLKKAIKNKIPVLCGVDDSPGTPNADTITDHFVVIVGMGSDAIGNYFLFYDNAVSDSNIGASLQNRLYCFCADSKLEGIGDTRNAYIQQTSKKKYTVSRIITSVKIKS